MNPLNGKARMTREERNARRRELHKNPFHAALTNKVRRAWHAKHREEVNAKRREKYWADPELRKRMAEARRANALANQEREKTSWKAWYAEHREEVCAKQRARTRTEVGRKYMLDANRKRQMRIETDPEFRAKIRAAERERRIRRMEKLKKNPAAYEEFMMRTVWRKKFESIVDSPEKIKSFLHATNEAGRKAFMKWYSRTKNLINRTDGLGHIVMKPDEDVPSIN